MGSLLDDTFMKEILKSINSGNNHIVTTNDATMQRKIERLEKEVADLKKELAENILLGGAGMDRNALKNLIREVMLEALANKESK